MAQADYTLTLTDADTNYRLSDLLTAEGYTGLLAFSEMTFQSLTGTVRVGGSGLSDTEAGSKIEVDGSHTERSSGPHDPLNAPDYYLRGLTTPGLTVNFKGRPFYS
jgi:hypothetical protein